ncbi:unnamed protein product [Penicillium camemberti]|uniref:Str. FM013 n=1 Tax=Penicillium camemberti (strain FM 013) TaxID=1429867 RepID=A0A0G4P427_PENC3|nr:unnamed protein product [Penicillium camemberti]
MLSLLSVVNHVAMPMTSVNLIEIVRTVAVAIRALCSALDCLIKSYGKAHALVGKRGENAMMVVTPHSKRVKSEHCSRQNLHLAANFDSGLHWYLSIISFKQPIKELIRNEYGHSDTNTVTWYTAMLATFPLIIPGL